MAATAMTLAAATTLVGLPRVGDQRLGSWVVFALVATAMAIIWNARCVRGTRRSAIVGVRRGAVIAWGGAGFALGLASWALFWWNGPTDAVLMRKGLAFVVVATAGGVAQGWFREADRLERSTGVRGA